MSSEIDTKFESIVDEDWQAFIPALFKYTAQVFGDGAGIILVLTMLMTVYDVFARSSVCRFQMLPCQKPIGRNYKWSQCDKPGRSHNRASDGNVFAQQRGDAVVAHGKWKVHRFAHADFECRPNAA